MAGYPELQAILDNKPLLSLISAIGGGILVKIISFIQGKIKHLEWTVNHERAGISENNAVFGDVSVTWRGNPLRNLFISTVILHNDTNKDFSNLEFKIHANDTVLLSQYTEIVGTSYILGYTDKYTELIKVPDDGQPTEQQKIFYNHSREFNIPVLNRGKKALVRLLTTVPSGGTPVVFLDLLKEGLVAKFKKNENEIFGVPLSKASPYGIASVLLIVITVIAFVDEVWVSSALCALVGLFAQIIGVLVYKIQKEIARIVLS